MDPQKNSYKDERGDLMEEREIEALAQMPLKGPGLPKGSHRRCPNPQPLRQQNLPRGSTTSELSRAGVGSAQKGTKMQLYSVEGELGGVEVGERSVEEYVFQEFRHEQHSSLEENEWSEKLKEDINKQGRTTSNSSWTQRFSKFSAQRSVSSVANTALTSPSWTASAFRWCQTWLYYSSRPVHIESGDS